MSNSSAAKVTIKALRAGGLVEPADEALVTAALGLAAAVDADPANASLWREYRAVLEQLRGLGEAGGDDEFSRLLAALRAPLGDAEDAGPPDQGRQGGADRRGARPAADAVAAPGGRRRARGDA